MKACLCRSWRTLSGKGCLNSGISEPTLHSAAASETGQSSPHVAGLAALVRNPNRCAHSHTYADRHAHAHARRDNLSRRNPMRHLQRWQVLLLRAGVRADRRLGMHGWRRVRFRDESHAGRGHPNANANANPDSLTRRSPQAAALC